MVSKIQKRLAGEGGFTLIELLVVIVILGILVAIAVPSYLSFRGNAQQAAAQSNVRSAIPAAEAFYQIGSTYTGLTSATLQTQAPGVTVSDVTVSGDGNAYCLDAVSGSKNAYYIGGDQNIGGDHKGFQALSGATVAAVTTGNTCAGVAATAGS
jgi:type IV pilus assembly protein PilA